MTDLKSKEKKSHHDKMRMKRSLIIILFLLQPFSFVCFSQTGDPAFSHLSTAEGLSQNSVFAIIKDYKGFMWFATDEGLNKYDGYKFTVYKHDPGDHRSISNNSISDILEDAAHNLWVVSRGGIDRFDRIHETFVHYSAGNKDNVFKSIFQDSKKRFWLSTITEGLCLFDPGKASFKFYKKNDGDADSPNQNYVYRVVEDNSGALWIAKRNGLDRFNPETGKNVHYSNEPGNDKSIGAGYIKTVYKDGKGNIWAGTQGNGVALYNRASNSFINFKHDPFDKRSICHHDILSFAEDRNGKLWIGTENGGISIFDDATRTFSSFQNDEYNPYSISGNSVYCLYKDDIGNMWAGTWSGGANFLPVFGNKFTHYKKNPADNNSLSNNLVLSISGDRDNNVWIGTDGGGLNYFDAATHRFIHYQHDSTNSNSIFNNYVLSATEYLPGVLALGFHRGGIDLFDTHQKKFAHYAPKGHNTKRLSSPSINIVYKDRQDNLWLGTNDNGGLYLFNKITKTFTNYAPDPGNNKSINGGVVFTIYETRAGQIWLGGDKGLDLFDRNLNAFIHHEHDVKNKESLINNTVYAIREDGAGNLWLGTAGGLNYFDIKKNSFTAYTEKDGLPNNNVWGIEQDHHGNLWISTNKGLSKFTPSTRTFRNYSISDGLQSNSFRAKATYQSAAGEMFFGGVNGFNTFYPDSIKDNDFVPPVYITGFQVFNKPVSIGVNSPLQQSVNEVKEITLSYKQSVFTLEFAALNFTHPEQNSYAYMLDGFDKEWNYTGNKRLATYTNLNPGRYVFKVKGSNNDGVWNNTATEVIITVLPPFWLTWWFIMAECIVMFGGVISIYLFRINIIKKQKLLLQRKVNEQTIQLVHLNEEERKARLESESARAASEMAREEAAEANDKLQKKNKELEQFAYVASHDLQEPLRMVTGFLGQLEKKYGTVIDDNGKRYIHFAVDGAKRMRQIILDLLEYSRVGNVEESQQDVDLDQLLKDIQVLFGKEIEEKKAVIQADHLPVVKGNKAPLRQAFQNLVGNALKYSKKDGAHIQIKVTALETHWQFAVADNGIGIAEEHFDKIFVLFQRLHNNNEFAGTGIGLAITKKIIENMGGKIWVSSEEGKGSTFYFTILKNNL